MMFERENIRPAIKEMETMQLLQALLVACWDTTKEDADFIKECASEIYHRQKEQKNDNET